MMALVGTLSYNFQTVFPLFSTRDLHGSGATFTALFSIVSVGALVGALAVARRTRISIRSVAVSTLAYGAALALMAVAIGGPIVGFVSEQLGARYGIGIGAAAALVAGAFGFVFDRRRTARTIAARDAEVTVLDGVGELAVPPARAAS
jgi:hypothetical protein